MCFVGTPCYSCGCTGPVAFMPGTESPCPRAQALACPTLGCGYKSDLGCYNVRALCPVCAAGGPFRPTQGMKGAQGMSLQGMLCALEAAVGTRQPTSALVARANGDDKKKVTPPVTPQSSVVRERGGAWVAGE